MCRAFPRATDWRPLACSYTFDAHGRHGVCDPNACGADSCCNFPRAHGEPEGTTRHDRLGLPCQYLRGLEAHPQRSDGVYVTSSMFRVGTLIVAHERGFVHVGEFDEHDITATLWSARVPSDAFMDYLRAQPPGDVTFTLRGPSTHRVTIKGEHVAAVLALVPEAPIFTSEHDHA